MIIFSTLVSITLAFAFPGSQWLLLIEAIVAMIDDLAFVGRTNDRVLRGVLSAVVLMSIFVHNLLLVFVA